MNHLELTGQVRSHLVEVPEPPCNLHAHVVAPFQNLRRAALADGFNLWPVSSFRDFSRQVAIWNGKFSGTQPMLDAAGGVLEALCLSDDQRIDAILLWSALPGASRHHWGTDLDLIDGSALLSGYRVQLTESEFARQGPFAPLGDWLELNAARYGFFRPFRGVRSGVRPEPWHFSFAPVAENARRALYPAVLRAALVAAPLLGKKRVLARLDELHARFVATIDWP